MSSPHGDDALHADTPKCRISDEPLVEPLIHVFPSEGSDSSSTMIRVSIPDISFRQPIDLCCVVDVSGSTGEGELCYYVNHKP
jgi:hypothetical protein